MKNESNKKLKQATLQPDEFHPKGAFKSFWMVPKVIAANKDLSPGAKLLYGLIVVQCQLTGSAWPEHKTLRAELGGISEKTLNRWQMELVKLGLLRVNQKGRGLSNNYYLLRSVIVGNAEEGEFDSTARYLHKNIKTGEITVIEEWLVDINFRDDVHLWWTDVTNGIERAFPKPCGHYDRKKYGIVKREYAEKLANYIAGDPEIT